MVADNSSTGTILGHLMQPGTLLGASRLELNPAEWMYERITRQIIEFEKGLTSDEELGGRFVAAPREGIMHIEDIGFWGPDLLIFYGTDGNGRPVQLLQHYSQLTILLCAVPKEKDAPRRIGFVLEQRLERGKKPEANDEGQ